MGGWRQVVLRGALALCVLALGSAAPASAQAPELKVVVTSKPIHALVAEVMKGVGTPSLLVDGSASPHTYALRPSDAQRINRADVLFRVSEALEPFTARLVRALPRSVTVSTLAEARGVQLLLRRTGGPFDGHAHAGALSRKQGHGAHNHSHGGAPESPYDAHVWLDPDNAKAMAGAIAATLAARMPQAADRLEANAAALSGRLDRLAATLTEQLAPVTQRPFVVLHDAYQYFERRFGLAGIGSIVVDPDEQPSAKRLTDLRRRIGGLSAVCMFVEPGFSTRLVTSVTEGTTTRTAVLDPEGTLLEPGPDLYFTLMERMAGAMRSCLSTPA